MVHTTYRRKTIKRTGAATNPSLVLLMLAVASALGVSSPARAQTASTNPTVAASDETGLSEIVVTARKRVENMQSIPESIDAFGAVEIGDAHITRIDDLGNLVSNLNITTRADNTPDVVLRGIGSFGVVSGVGFYADDVQLFDGQSVRTDDVERIEVLKGPATSAVRSNTSPSCRPMSFTPERASSSATTAHRPIPDSSPVRWSPGSWTRARAFSMRIPTAISMTPF
jgi:hypothetical protein